MRKHQETALRVLAVIGSMNPDSVTRIVMAEAARQLGGLGCAVDSLDLFKEPLPIYGPESCEEAPGFAGIQRRVEAADVILVGTPDYHGSMSGALKNFLDYFWREYAGKLFASIVSSHEKGLTATDHLRTVARQCYAWTLPYGVSFEEDEDIQGGRIRSKALAGRLAMMTRDIAVYGRLLAAQRRADLACREPGFMARLRKSS
jgi:FMN reductase